MSIVAAQQIDANSRTVNSNESFLLESTWTFVEGTTGATGAHTVFTVTGNVLVTIFGICDTDLAGATATVEVGVTGNTAGLIAQTTATDIDDGDIWVDATPAVGVEATPSTFILNDGADIILTVGTAAVTGGVIDFYCLWRPLSSDGNITVTTAA